VNSRELLQKDTEEKLDYKKVLPIFVVILVDLLGLTIIIPLMSLYAASFGMSPMMIGILGSVYPVAQFIGAPILGRLSDKYGRKPILLISQIGTLIGFILLGAANQLWLLFLSRLIDGLSGANISTAQAVIADSTSPKTRTQGMGLIGAAFGIGFVIGPVISYVSLIFSNDNYHIPAFIAAACSLGSVLLTTFWLKETHAPGAPGTKQREVMTIGGFVDALRHPQVGVLLIILFVQQCAFGGMEKLMSLFTLGRLGLYASANAIVFVYIGFIVVLVQGKLIGMWSKRWGEERLVRGGLILLTLGFGLIAATPAQAVPWYSKTTIETELEAGRMLPGETPPTHHLSIPLPDESTKGYKGLIWFLVGIIPAAIGGGILHPSINSLLSKRVAPDEIGGILGISAALYSGANAVAPIAGGILFQSIGMTAPFWAWSLLTGVLSFIAVRYFKNSQ
jgi:DHA1 family tetracycline resistance protein-like MFS transporter